VFTVPQHFYQIFRSPNDISVFSSDYSDYTDVMMFFCYYQHLLCIILQAVACIALDPGNHGALSEADMPDTLMQLLLPSDEWYYTNHSTKYARYVKFHAARVLVYMGLFQRLGGRIDLFDLKRTYASVPSENCFVLTAAECGKSNLPHYMQ
jgi:hypothetical protein